MSLHDYIGQLVWRLRRPERFVQRLKILVNTQQARSLAELEELASSQGVEIVHADLGLRVYGATTSTDEAPLIVLQPGLDGPHRELTLAHELGHVHLHLRRLAQDESVGLPTVGGVEDVEADIYAFLCLIGKVSPQEEISRIVQYVCTDPKNLRRWWGIYRYSLFYHLRGKIADCLEFVFLRGPAQEVH